MGADGHIYIWKDEEVREAFPDCDELFQCLPTHYVNYIDDVRYHHCYSGDNLYAYWSDEEDWYVPHEWVKERTAEQSKERDEILQRLRPFVKWLEDNYIHWEVWT